MNLDDLDTSSPIPATVKQSARITPEGAAAEVRHIVLSLPEVHLVTQIGQSVGVITPGPHPFGNREHLRLYSIAGTGWDDGRAELALCVRRCFYIDEVSGERYPGTSSNRLCDARPGDIVLLTGPYGIPFPVPQDDTSNILMIGSGTGIAPFRAFVEHLYHSLGTWRGKVRLFYGADTGMELLYMNEVNTDLANYYTQDSFKAFEALSPSPHTGVPAALGRSLEQNRDEVWGLLQAPNTYVYLAGLKKSAEGLDRALARVAGSEEAWRRKKKELLFFERWTEVLYE